MSKKNTREALCTVREDLISYLRSKINQEDWHGVADAAMDLREVDAKFEMLEEMEKK